MPGTGTWPSFSIKVALQSSVKAIGSDRYLAPDWF